ncbi:EAL domain-containing protein [Salinimonas iocasae]|uniref:EAL domain-containing protein n=1 Tax=Salinimonas iocasae TaxID=2572577 RepID=A0A5B7YEU5_9ALTE|nr:EAL domain-containing protein [Salinimonas iocasae]QCZ94105.1 EAL domain-containing protein [Salinimonas iocasae]
MRSTIARLCTIFLLVCCGPLFTSSAHAVSVTDIYFEELTLRDGLSDTTILDIVEGPDGYIWIATLGGLNRYSGYEFKQYLPDSSNAASLPSGVVRSLFVTAEGVLWIGTLDGLARYQPESDDFKVFNQSNSSLKSNNISFIGSSSEGDLLVAAGARIYLYDNQSEIIKPYDSGLQFDSRVVTIHDEASKLLIGTYSNGLFIYDKTQKELFSATDANPYSFNISAQRIRDIAVIQGDYWIATNHGVYQIAGSGNTKKQLTVLTHPLMGSDNIFSILEVDEDIWLGTDNNLSIYSPTQEQFVSIGPQNAELTGLTQRYIFSGLQDTTGKIWMGSYHGLFTYNPQLDNSRLFSNEKAFQEKTEGNAIWALDEDAEGKIWFVTQSEGLGRFDKETGDISYFLENTGRTFWDLVIDDNGLFWIANSSGVSVYKPTNDQLIEIANFLPNQLIDTILYQEGQVWFSPADKNVQLIAVQSKLLKDRSDNVDVADLMEIHHVDISTSQSSLLHIDSKGRVWLNSTDNIIIYEPKRKKVIKQITLPSASGRVFFVYEWRNSFWLLNTNNAVFQLNQKSFEIKRQSQMGQAEGTVLSAQGVDSTVWITTNNTIYQLDLLTLEKKNTLYLEELNYNDFNENSVLQTTSGELIFGGTKGFNIIKPEELTGKSEAPIITKAPQVTVVRAFGDNLSDGDYARLGSQNVVELAYDESRFTINFELVNPANPTLVEYRYRLLGFDDNWIGAENSRTAQFNNVSFGSYVFEVQAREKGKTWSSSAQQSIHVGRPPWLHTVALVFYAVVVSTFLLFLLRQYQVRKHNQQAIRESEERLKLTLWSSGDELWDWDVYRGQVYRSNTWGTLDFPQDNIRTSTAYDANIHPNDLMRVQEALKSHLEDKTDFYELAYRAKTFSNQWIWILDRGKVVTRDHNNQPVRMTGTLKNIHHLKEAEEQLNLFKRSIENISEGVFITNTNFKFISVNNAYCTYTGETRDQALASYMYFHQYPEAFTEEIKKTLKTKGNWFGEVESVRVNGEKFEIELNIDAVHDEDGRISHFVGVFSDITSRKSTEKELLKLANADPLTDLPNRSFFQASHQNLVRRAEAHALLCLDMDNFKKINDSLGHQTGDVLIKQIAKRIQRMTGTTATCYRLGGDEFSILLEDKSDIHTITHFAQGLLDSLARPFIINKQEFVLGASIGIAFYPEDGTTSQEMLKNADTAMYFAKNNGGNSYKFFSGEMNQNAVRQLQIENLIRQGIKDDLFTVYYQPKVDIFTGRLVSMEALVRFEHPHKGIVSPGQFIPLAEQTGQIIEIGDQVLRKALSDTKRWVNQGIFTGRVAVNISAKQFELPDLDERIIKVLNDVGLSPLHLECELTEGTLMEHPEQGLMMMERLRERGIHLALDDFGTGYSSLAYLKRFPLNTLKIDKAFIDDIAKSNVDRHMAASIINIAHNLGLKVVAEGVEHENQLSILRQYECEMLQGYLYSKPLPADRFEQLLNENQKLHELINQPKV